MRIKTVTPRKLPPKNLDWASFGPVASRAHRELGKLEALLQKTPYKILTLLKMEEAIASILPQGNHIKLSELLAHSLNQLPVQPDLLPVSDYLAALDFLYKKRNHPLTLTQLRKVHFLIKQHTYVKKKDIGRFRDRQNWIGPKGCSIEQAYFFPPRHTRVLRDMKEWLRYTKTSEKDPLVQISLLFAQLLIIHPFMDGNGRVARALVPFFAHQKKLLSAPILYMSHYFESNRAQYFQKLYLISAANDWEGWITFFLKGVIEQAQHVQKKIENLSKANKALIEILDSKKTADLLFEQLAFEKTMFQTRVWEQLKKKRLIVPYRKNKLIYFLKYTLQVM